MLSKVRDEAAELSWEGNQDAQESRPADKVLSARDQSECISDPRAAGGRGFEAGGPREGRRSHAPQCRPPQVLRQREVAGGVGRAHSEPRGQAGSRRSSHPPPPTCGLTRHSAASVLGLRLLRPPGSGRAGSSPPQAHPHTHSRGRTTPHHQVSIPTEEHLTLFSYSYYGL